MAIRSVSVAPLRTWLQAVREANPGVFDLSTVDIALARSDGSLTAIRESVDPVLGTLADLIATETCTHYYVTNNGGLNFCRALPATARAGLDRVRFTN